MKTFTTLLLIASSVFALTACSNKEEEPKPPAVERGSEDPQTRYGKAVQQTEELTKKIEADRAEADAIFDE